MRSVALALAGACAVQAFPQPTPAPHRGVVRRQCADWRCIFSSESVDRDIASSSASSASVISAISASSVSVASVASVSSAAIASASVSAYCAGSASQCRGSTYIVGLDDIAVCSWPYGIPVKGGPGLPTDQSNGGHTIKEPSLELWQFLNMDAWLQATITTCPSIVDPALLAKWTWPVLLAKYLIGDGAISNCGDPTSCTWDPQTDGPGNHRGAITGSGTHPPISDTPTDAEILEYRRWYGMQALRQLNLHFQATSDMINEAAEELETSLVSFTNVLYTTPPKPADTGFSFLDFLDIFKGVAAFLPFGNIVTGAIAAFDSVEVVADALNGDPKDAILNAKDLAANVASIISGKEATLGDRIKNSVADFGQSASMIIADSDKKPGSGKTPSFNDLGGVMDAFGNLRTALKQSFRAQWSTSIHGDPRTPDVGYFDQVSGGQMAGLKPTDDATMAQLTENLKAFLKRQVFQYLLRSTGLFIFTQFWADDGYRGYGTLNPNWEQYRRCQDPWGRTGLIRGMVLAQHVRDTDETWKAQYCVDDQTGENVNDAGYTPSGAGFDSWMSLTSDLNIANAEAQKWASLTDANMATLGFPPVMDIYKASAACFDSTNQDWYDQKVATPTTWSQPIGQSVFTSVKPYTPNLCDWSIPTWNANKANAYCNDRAWCPIFDLDEQEQRTADMVLNDKPGQALQLAAGFFYPAPTTSATSRSRFRRVRRG